jgi:hypothetical protein
MEENNNENPQFKYEEADRPFNYGMKHSNDYDWNKHGQGGYGNKWPGGYGNKWPGGYGPYFPGAYGPFYPNIYGINYGLPWLLLALKSVNPRDLMRYVEEMENMNY